MKISVDDKELFTISEMQMTVFKSYINADDLEDDLKRRLDYILSHKYEECLNRLKLEWMPKLSSRVSKIPENTEDLIHLILSQPDYKCRKTLEDEKRAKEQFEKSSTFQTQ